MWYVVSPKEDVVCHGNEGTPVAWAGVVQCLSRYLTGALYTYVSVVYVWVILYYAPALKYLKAGPVHFDKLHI
jgi:hypothetical protein